MQRNPFRAKMMPFDREKWPNWTSDDSRAGCRAIRRRTHGNKRKSLRSHRTGR